jgi:hypothetical protein
VVAQGRQRPWQPRGSGLLVAVVALSVVALVVHGVIALVLLNGTVHRNVAAGQGSAPWTKPLPSSSLPDASPTPSPTPAPGATDTSWTAPDGGGALHLDDSCLIADNPPTQATFPVQDPFGTTRSDPGVGAELQRVYAVDDRTLTPADGAGPVRDCGKQLWSVIVATMPITVRPFLKELVVFDALLTGGTSDLYVGEVVRAESDASRWRLAIAPNRATDLDVAVTVAHEVGHLLSLNASQLDVARNASACSTIWTGQGCLSNDGHVMTFLDDTWSDAEIDAWNEAAHKPDHERDQAFQDFYNHHAGSFVDSYAASDPFEDFAESFGIWCALGPGSPLISQAVEGNPANGHTKIDWFEHSSPDVKGSTQDSCTRLRGLTR